MEIAFITIFPEMFPGPLAFGVVGRALRTGAVSIEAIDLRDFSGNRQRQVDDYAYGGGGMVLLPGPAAAAVEHARESSGHVVFMTPQGRPLTHSDCQQLAGRERLVILCGRYEGLDERVRQEYVDEEYSVGDFVATGGELPAMLLAESVVRLLPGVVGNPTTVHTDSFATGLLEHPQYTRPQTFAGQPVPPVLTSGDHAAVALWRRREALRRTLRRRPDLLANAELSESEGEWLAAVEPAAWACLGRDNQAK